MKRIQFDTVNGVSAVSEFDDGLEIVPEPDILKTLDKARDGIMYGATVSDETFTIVDALYGVH